MPRNPDGWGRKPHKWRDRWRAFLTIGYAPNGEPVRKYVYGRTERECGDKLLDLRSQVQYGDVPERITLAAYARDWLKQKAREVKPRTIEVYERDLAYPLQVLGRMQLANIKPLHVQRMMHSLSERAYTIHGTRTRRKYGVRSANQARGVLANALGDAVRLGLIPTNPVTRVKPFARSSKDYTIWTAQQVVTFLDTTAAAAASYHALFYLALTTGLRAGELLALEWRDVKGSKLHVRRTVTMKNGRAEVGEPKSASGKRVLDLPQDALDVLAVRLRATEEEGIDTRLVFPTSSGGMVSHSNLRRSLHRWADEAGVPKLRPHDLRHTYASMAISQGMTPADLARQLGHTDASFTLRQYVHFFESARPSAAPSLRDLTGHGATGGRLGGNMDEMAPEAPS